MGVVTLVVLLDYGQIFHIDLGADALLSVALQQLRAHDSCDVHWLASDSNCCERLVEHYYLRVVGLGNNSTKQYVDGERLFVLLQCALLCEDEVKY